MNRPKLSSLSDALYIDHGASGSPIWNLVKVTATSISQVAILSSVGYILARRGIIDKRTQTKINKLNVSFFTPALLFSKVAFTLNPARLAELFIVPIGFVLVAVVSTLSALFLSWVARLSRAQRNFAIACAISPNSNSLPVALMQSLVVTVPQLHWEEQGEPEDTVDGMLGRSLTYLVLFSTLGMCLRWSIGAKLLSTIDNDQDVPQQQHLNRLSDPNNAYSDDATADLVDCGQNQQTESASQVTPRVTLRRPTAERRLEPKRTGPPAWARSFPNSPTAIETNFNRLQTNQQTEPDSDDETIQEQGAISLPGAANSRDHRFSLSILKLKFRKAYRTLLVKPLKLIDSFMTAPLYAAIMSLIVALFGPLQKFIGSLEPVVGAIETAGACSIPLTMVVLGAYFHQDSSAVLLEGNNSNENNTNTNDDSLNVVPTIAENDGSNPSSPSLTKRKSTKPTNSKLDDDDNDDEDECVQDPWRQSSIDSSLDSSESTLVQKRRSPRKRISSWITKNPWGNSSSSDLENGSMTDEPQTISSSTQADQQTPSSNVALRNADLNSRGSAGRRAGAISKEQRKEKELRTMEKRTIAVAISARMILTPLILIPILAWYAIATRYNVVDDPVFITCACLLIGSPPALTLAQITSQKAHGNSGFERLISRTIFASYAFFAAPTTILLVLTSLLIAENDH